MNDLLQKQTNIDLKSCFTLLDQIFELERKAENNKELASIKRNINRMKDTFENMFASSTESDVGLTYHNPIGEKYSETRTDLNASIAGTSPEDLVVTEVIKPIIRYRKSGNTHIVRKGVVVVESPTN